MKTLKEKITFVLTAIVYSLFHLAVAPLQGGGYRIDFQGTLTALASTIPFEIAFTYMVVFFIIKNTDGVKPPWDRILRIFFTIGILFGLVYNLYVRGAIEEQRLEKGTPTVSRSVIHADLKQRLHSA